MCACVHGCIFPGSHRQRSIDIKHMQEVIGRPASMSIRDWQSQGAHSTGDGNVEVYSREGGRSHAASYPHYKI